MNHCYRLVFNHIMQAWQAVAEFAKARHKSSGKPSKGESKNKPDAIALLLRLNKLAVCMALGQVLAMPSTVYALPAGADIQFGQATFQTTGNNLTINQGTKQLITNWQSFGIASNESVRLLQPKQGMALFRVVGSEASQIYGSLNATGSLFLINPNGVLFGQGAQIDVGSLVATSMNISNTDFLGGRYEFNADGSTGSVINQGIIKAADGGYIVMLGNEVNNSGTLNANNGSVVMGSAQSAVLDFYGNGLVRAKLSGEALNALVEQTGAIQADGGTVQLATNSRSSAVNVSGLVQANSLVERNGVIRLEGGTNAKVSVSGILSAAGNNAGTKGGIIEVTGEQVALFRNAKLDASGDSGGGEVLVGGDYQGKNAQILNAGTTYVDKDASISVDAKENGEGGKAIVWADDITRFYGNISAKGGALSGNGGFVEVSGKRVLDFIGGVDVNAAKGLGGFVLLDPQDILLNTTTQVSPANNANGTPDVAFGAAPIAGTATIQIADITGFSELFLQATNNITIANTFTMAVNNSIRLEANNNIAVNAAVAVSGTGNINFKADADNSGSGNLAIGANITSQAGGITLTGATITRTAGNIASTGVANGDAGNINIAGTSAVNLGATTVSATGGIASAGTAGRNGGLITISGAGVTTTGAITASGSNGNGANQNGGNAGSVAITSTNGISTGVITSSGGNAGTGIANGGDAGMVTLSNNTAGSIAAGALTARAGNAIGTGAGGAIGAINVTNNASGTLTTGALSAAGGSNGNGGTINLTTASGNIITTTIISSGGTALTGTAGRNAGAININSGGSVATTTIAANGGNGVGASQNGGNAANITITGNGGITATTGSASGGLGTTALANGGSAAAINISNSLSGNIGVTALNANAANAFGTGTGGTVGSISVTNTAASGNITTTNISTVGGTNAHGGNVLLSSLGDVTVTGTIGTSGGTLGTGSVAGGRNAGNITITGVNRSVTGVITASGATGLGTDQAGGNAGTVSITGSGTLDTAAINSRNGAATGLGAGGAVGGITLNGTKVTTGALTTTGGNNGNGGTISVTSTSGTLGVGAIASSGGGAQPGTAGRNGGAITLNSTGALTAGTITANAGAGSGANQAGGDAGTLSAISTGGAVTVAAISVAGGNAGTGNANGGNGVAVTLDAGGATPTITMASVTTTGGNRVGTGTAGAGGSLNVADAALLSADTTITTTGGSAGVGTGGAVNFAGTVNSLGANRALTINSNAATTLNGALGNTFALTSLTTNATGTTAINGGAVTTTGAQTYSDNVTLGAPTTLTTTNSNVTFTAASSVLNSVGNTLTIAAGTGAVSATNAANNFANLAITAGSANIRDANTIVLGASNVTGAYTLATAGAVTQSGAVTVGGATTLAAGAANDITLNNTSNNFNNVIITSGRDVSLVDANALTVGASSVRTITAQTLSGDFTLGGAITATGIGSGTSIRLASAQNFINTGNFGLTPGIGSRWLVYSTSPTADTRGAGLITASNFKQYNTTFPGTISGTGNGFVYSVTPTITATLSGTASKIYDGTTTASIAGLTLGQAGAIDGDIVTMTGSLTSATYDDKNVGTGKTLTSNSGLTITGATNGGKQVFGYTLASSNATGNVGEITQRAITVSAASDTKTYDGNVSSIGAPTVTSGLIVVGDAGSFSQTFDNKNAGTGKTLTATGSVNDGNSGNNYAVTFATDNTGEITQRAITVSAASDTKTYDGNVSSIGAPTVTSGLIVVGDAGSFNQTFDNKNAGTGKTLTAAGAVADGNSGNNYAVTFATNNTGIINQRAITVTAATDTKTYDGNTGSIGAPTVTSGSIVAGDAGAFSQTFDNKNAGTGKTLTAAGAVADGNSGNNYAVTFATNNTGIINQRAITVTAATDTKTYDGNTGSIGAPTVTSGSIVAGDAGAFSQTFDNKNAGTGKTLTAAGAVADGNSGNNYAVTFATNNTGIINQRAITVTANAGQTKLVGSVDPLPFTFTIGGLGLVGGDTLSGALDRVAGETLGNYAINLGSLDAGNNYTINYIGNTFAISAPSVTSQNSGSLRAAAGLVGLLASNNRPTQSLAILNVAAPGAGDDTDVENATEACQTNTDPKLNNPNTSIIFNFGIKLPKGVKPVCI